MRVEKKVSGFLIFFFCVAFWMVIGEEKISKEKPELKAEKSLIRKELLFVERKELKPPRRNIFSLRSSGIREEESEAFEVPQGPQEAGTDSENEALLSSFSLRYIGYIDSGQRIVALIIFEGQAVAVEKGERISEQLQVGKITTKEIEIIGPGAEKRTYSLEGEEE